LTKEVSYPPSWVVTGMMLPTKNRQKSYSAANSQRLPPCGQSN
jgi:hypothetical protein